MCSNVKIKKKSIKTRRFGLSAKKMWKISFARRNRTGIVLFFPLPKLPGNSENDLYRVPDDRPPSVSNFRSTPDECRTTTLFVQVFTKRKKQTITQNQYGLSVRSDSVERYCGPSQGRKNK